MYVLPTAPRPIGGVLDDAIRLYRASFARCWGLALTSGLLATAAGLYQTLQLGSLNLRTATPAGALAMMNRLHATERSPALWLSYVVTALLWLVFRAAIIVRQNAWATGQSDSFGAAVGFAVRRLPNLVVGAIVWGVVITVGTILFIVPGIYLWGSLELWVVALCAEDLGPFGALHRSHRLIERNWWRTTTTVAVALIIMLVLSTVAVLVTGGFMAAARGDLALFTLITQLSGVLVGVFTTPMLMAVMLSLYYDLKLRREGGDLAARLSTLKPA